MKKLPLVPALLSALILGLPAVAHAQEVTNGTTTQVEATDDTSVTVSAASSARVTATSTGGAQPLRTTDTVSNEDGSRTVTRTISHSATGAAPARTRTKEMTFNADGSLATHSSTEIRTAADETVLRERTSSITVGDGAAVRSRIDTRIEEKVRPERAERIARLERPEKLERLERVERLERMERPEKLERIERLERRERD